MRTGWCFLAQAWEAVAQVATATSTMKNVKRRGGNSMGAPGVDVGGR
jgi:hypothetical protein